MKITRGPALLAAAVIAAALAACGSGTRTVSAPDTVAGCTAAFAQQIGYSQAHHLVHPDLPTPAACSALTSAQRQVAALRAVTETMP